MAEYIKKSDALDVLEHCAMWNKGINAAHDEVQAITAADAEEVTRCVECIYSEQHDLLPYKYLCHLHKIERRAMCFCSEGKRIGENLDKEIIEITECLKQINGIFERERRKSDAPDRR